MLAALALSPFTKGDLFPLCPFHLQLSPFDEGGQTRCEARGRGLLNLQNHAFARPEDQGFEEQPLPCLATGAVEHLSDHVHL